jgi:tRNA threonylcarbamoyladenosine biosynthesis protein TsaB
MAGVAPAGSLDALEEGGDDIDGVVREYNIALQVRILALDTSSTAGSAALVRDGAIVIERPGDASRTHGERLPRELMAVLDAAGLRLADVDRFAIAIGPGSFTGLRIGIATIQGLALAQGKLVVPVSTFDALRAAAPRSASSALGVWIDAHRGEVFATLYDGDGRVRHDPTSLAPDATLDAWGPALAGSRVQFEGDGAIRYRAAIETRVGAAAVIPATVPPLAGAIGLMAAREPDRAVRPHAVVPLYVRRPDAELARDRKQPAGGA